MTLRALDPDDPLYKEADVMAERMWNVMGTEGSELNPSVVTAAVILLLSHFVLDFVKADKREQYMVGIRDSVLKTAAGAEAQTATKQ